METKTKERGAVELSPVQNCTSNPKMLSLDFIGHEEGRYYFKEKGAASGPAFFGDLSDYQEWITVRREDDRVTCQHPDHTCKCSGTENSCGKTIAAIIDADAIRAQARAKRIVEEMSARMTKAVQRPIIIAPDAPSPHAFLDDPMLGRIDHINEELAIIRKVVL